MNNSNHPEPPISLPPDNTVSVILFCPSLLDRISLQTTINAIPSAKVVAKSADIELTAQLVHKHTPDILLADAYSLPGELIGLLEQAKEASPSTLCVVLLPGSARRAPYADYAMNQGNLIQQFTEVIAAVQAKRENKTQDY